MILKFYLVNQFFFLAFSIISIFVLCQSLGCWLGCVQQTISDCWIFGNQIHLFDIDIPGKITFQESKTLSAGETPTIVDAGLFFFSFLKQLAFRF